MILAISIFQRAFKSDSYDISVSFEWPDVGCFTILPLLIYNIKAFYLIINF